MARDASFLFEFVADFWDLLPTEDRKLFGAYWHGITQVIADLYQNSFESTLATTVRDVQVFNTSRWNRYQLNASTATIAAKTSNIALTGTGSESLGEDAILFNTLAVTNSKRNIFHSETITLVEEEIFDLGYEYIVPDTVRVSHSTTFFIEGKDYNLNKDLGKINRIEAGNIPNGMTVTISYMHALYKEDVDYSIDQVHRTIARIATGNIPSGDTVEVLYDYDETVADEMAGKCTITAATRLVEDQNTDMTGVLPGRMVTILTGVNMGEYTVQSVISASTVRVVEAMVANDVLVSYTINAFPYAISADGNIASIPNMQDTIIDPTMVLSEGIDYLPGNKKVSFRVQPPITREERRPTLATLFTYPRTETIGGGSLWAEETLYDKETVYRNFGVLIDFYRESSQDFLNAVRGLWRTYWTGSTHENLLRGMHIILGLPFAVKEGTATSVTYVEQLVKDISSAADFSTPPIRSITLSASDSITASTKRFLFPGIPGPDSFSPSDVTKLIRIQSSVAGNNGYYTISSIIGPTEVQVSETVPSDETAGFSAIVYESSPINIYTNADPIFIHDDIGKTLRVSGSTSNDGDYIISDIVTPYSVSVTSAFPAIAGPGGATVRVYEEIPNQITITDTDGLVYRYTVPSGLAPLVSEGDSVEQFQRLTTGVRIFDKINSGNFVEEKLGRVGIQRFLTQNASKGSGSSDETKALLLLMEHLWLPQVLTSVCSESSNVLEVVKFLNNLKPQWSEFVFSFADDFTDTLKMGETLRPSDISLTIDLTTILRNSWFNIAETEQFAYSGNGFVDTLQIRAPVTALSIKAPFYFAATDGNFTDADIGRQVVIGGSGSGNDGRYTISNILSTTEVLVSKAFTVDETGGGLTSSIQAFVKLTDLDATFISKAAIGDIIRMNDPINEGFYEIAEILSDTTVLVSETNLSGRFEEAGGLLPFDLISQTWFMDRDAINLHESFLHERTDGAATAPSTFTVNSALDLYTMGVNVGYVLVIKSGANMGVYNIASIVSKTQFTVVEATLTTLGSQNYSICQAAIFVDDGGTPVAAIPI